MGASLSSFVHEAPPRESTALVKHSTKDLHPQNRECMSAGLPRTLVDWPTLEGGREHHDKRECPALMYSPTKHGVGGRRQA
jgi:hypothetical protein